MWVTELSCIAILALFFGTRLRTRRDVVDAVLVGASAWVGENTCVRLYHFYAYAQGYHARLDQVPLLIVLIWPAVVLSAQSMAESLARDATSLRRAVLTGALVTFDAALIEPIAVRSGLWSWSEPGIFTVPLVGIVGWGFFAFAVTLVTSARPPAVRWGALVLAPLLTHALLLSSWWGGFRWALRSEVAPILGTAFVAVASAALSVAVVRSRARLAARDLFARFVATLFFGVLLVRAFHGPLALYALAFTPPHLLLVAQSLRRPVASDRAMRDAASTS